MKRLLLDADAVAVLTDFCENDTLANRIELIEDLNDNLLDQLGQTEDGEAATRKKLTDWMIALHDMKDDLRRIRRAQG